MRSSFAGRVRNLKSPKGQPLLPIFEAVINSIHSIEESKRTDGKIEIFVERNYDQPMLGEPLSPTAPIVGFVIEDNGSGFNDKNYESFLITDSENKAHIGGKGIGRLQWVKAFDEIEIESFYIENAIFYKRKFLFGDLGVTGDAIPIILENVDPLTRVTLKKYKSEIKSDKIPKILETLAWKFLEHFIDLFIVGNAPQMIIKDERDYLSINSLYQSSLLKSPVEDTIKIGENELAIKTICLSSRSASDHKVYLLADHRTVLDFSVSEFNPNFDKPFETKDNKYYVISSISGDILDKSANPERDDFDIVNESGFEEILSKAYLFERIVNKISNMFENQVKQVEFEK